MDGDARLWNTREFVAQWNAATEAHLVHQMQKVLADLVDRGTAPSLSQPEIERLAPLLVHALQVAAAREGGAHAAIQYLSEFAGGTRETAG
jgi:hypothetical protein